jgi:hypothetical protein
MSDAKVAWPVLGQSRTRGSHLSWLAAIVGVVALLGWTGDAAHLLERSHSLASAVTLGLGGLSSVFLTAFLATSAAVRWQRVQPRSADQCRHIHVPRPGRDYFSPYSTCSVQGADEGGDRDESRTAQRTRLYPPDAGAPVEAGDRRGSSAGDEASRGRGPEERPAPARLDRPATAGEGRAERTSHISANGM